jgi:phage head maturation protease
MWFSVIPDDPIVAGWWAKREDLVSSAHVVPDEEHLAQLRHRAGRYVAELDRVLGPMPGHRAAVEIFERRAPAVLSDEVDFEQRIIDVIAVPYEQEAEIVWRGETWREVFARTAFHGIENHAGRIPVNREHVLGDTVGKVVRLDSYDRRGLLASMKIARTARGDDTLQLAAEGMLGASVGYFVKKGSDVETNRRTMLRRVKRAFLDHLAMVGSPAYVGADTVAVRGGGWIG